MDKEYRKYQRLVKSMQTRGVFKPVRKSKWRRAVLEDK